MAQRPILIPNESTIGQLFVAQLTIKAARMPAGRHRFDHTTNHEITAFIAAWREQHLKVTFAILATLKLIEDAVLETAEALCTPDGQTG